MKFVEKKGNFFLPSKEAKKNSLAPADVYIKAKKDRIAFWDSLAKEGLVWSSPWKKTYEQKGINFKWFIEGKINLCYNAVDRHLSRPDNPAIIFVPENPQEKPQIISYFELYRQVNNAAARLKEMGINRGDVVAIYLPMIPETLITMLACQRIGAIHSVVFSAFSAEALRTRIEDGGAKLLVSCNFYYRKGEKADLESKANEACNGLNIQKLIYDRNNTGKIYAYDGKLIKPEQMEANETAFILYTSGTTGKPKGIMHAVGGYATQAYWSCRYVFNLQPGEIMWCTADIGWITGHTYACYGPLLNGVTTLIYEGLPNYPNSERFLQIIEQNNVNVFYTAPTALRMFALEGEEYTKKYKCESLKILGSVGEPIDEKTWIWFFNNVGKKRCPVIDTYWQTETGSAVINSLPGHGPFIPTMAAVPLPGIEFAVVEEETGKKIKTGKEGILVQLPPFAPATIRGVWKNEERYKKYFLKGNYNTEDRAYQNKKGHFRILGRGDDVIKVAGHRLSTAEIENAIQTIQNVAEAVIVGKPDELRGMVPVAFVKTKGPVSEKEVIDSVLKKIGPIARPAEVYFVSDIPKTRSGKMMRRIMKAILANEDVGNTMTLVNPECVDEIKKTVAAKLQNSNSKK